MHTRLVLAAALAMLGSACSFDVEGVDPRPVGPLHDQLGHRAFMTLQPSSAVSVQATTVDGSSVPALQPYVVGGQAVMRSTNTGLLLVEKLEVDLADVVIPAGLISPDPLHLTELRLGLGTQLVTTATWGEEGAWAAGAGEADLFLDWSLLLDSGPYSLGSRRMVDVPFSVAARIDDDGVITAQIAADLHGDLSRFIDRMTLSNFSMAVEATTARDGDDR